MTLTDILTKHRYREQDHSTIAYRSHCCCGWWEHTNGKREIDVHAAHVVEEMAAANIVAIELPEADTLGCWEAGTDTVFRDGDEISAVVSSASEAQLVYPTDPAALAAALLAAAVRPTPTPGENP